MTLEEKNVQDELRRVDPELFLDKLYDHEGQYIYYAVRYPVGAGVEPLTCVHWRTQDGPLPLSLDLVGVVRRQEGDIRDSIKEVIVNNAVRSEKARTEMLDNIDDELKWIEKSAKRRGIYGPWSPKHDLR